MYEKISQEAQKYNAQLIVVSKTRANSAVEHIYNKGQKAFGENRVQELLDKKDVLPSDIQWHLIGHLQSNKVKYIAPFISMIQSIDSAKVWKEVHKEAKKNERVIPVLLQLKIAEEESKYGFDIDELKELLRDGKQEQWIHAKPVGLMGMATFTENQDQVRNEFKQLKRYFEEIKTEYFPRDLNFKEISMGMSGDYPVAMQEGSTMIRVGSAIFEK